MITQQTLDMDVIWVRCWEGRIGCFWCYDSSPNYAHYHSTSVGSCALREVSNICYMLFIFFSCWLCFTSSLGQCTFSSDRGEGCLNIIISVYKYILEDAEEITLHLKQECGDIYNDL